MRFETLRGAAGALAEHVGRLVDVTDVGVELQQHRLPGDNIAGAIQSDVSLCDGGVGRFVVVNSVGRQDLPILPQHHAASRGDVFLIHAVNTLGFDDARSGARLRRYDQP